jgi:ABC-type Fe3+-hydroxamate transport system substrate-binding protein
MRAILRCVAAAGAVCLAACGEGGGGSAATTTAPASEPSTTQAGPRIVSTVPAATLNLTLIGAADRLVGVTKYDTLYLPPAQQDLPVVGDYETMNYERLVGLHPTAVIVQTDVARVSPRLTELAATHHIEIVNIKLDTLADLWETVRKIGKVAGKEAAAERAVTEAQAELAEIQKQNAGKKRVRVVYALSENPVMVVGGKTFVDEMLNIAGAENVGATVGDGWPMIGTEALAKLAPEVLLVSAAGQPPQVGGSNDPRVEKWLRLPMPASEKGRVYLITEGNSLMASVEAPAHVRRLAELIHAGEPAATQAGAGMGGGQ